MDVSRADVYAALDSEREYQKRRAEEASGPGSGEHRHSVEEFVIYIEDYVDELRHHLSRTWTANGQADLASLDILRKVTALGVACMEQHGAPCRQ